MAADGETITTIGPGAEVCRGKLAPALFLVLECDRPRAGGARYALRNLDRVVIGRPEGKDARHAKMDDQRVLRLAVPDLRMSTEHARLEHVFGKWVVVDSGSKNGTVVNGERLDMATLQDGDLIELGHTFFRYREALLGEDDPNELEGGVGIGRLKTLVPAAQRSLERVARVAASEVPVLLLGESGVGKELVARAIHELSGRCGSLVAVNCGALPDTLVESELFGYRRGAFSGAVEDREGYLRASAGGTLLLDEIADLPLRAQAAFLRALQEREVTPVGDTRPVAVDLRVVASTHRDLDALVAKKSFRADLYARLCGVKIEIPPLRERIEDLGGLVAELLRSDAAITREAARALLCYQWPLNVRELVQCLDGACAVAGEGAIAPEHLPAAVGEARPKPRRIDPASLSDDDAALRAKLVELLAQHQGNISAVARSFGKARQQIHRWITRFSIDLADYR